MIPGFIIALLTFPGVIVHELAHQLFCRWMRVAVFNVCYYRIGNPSGYVIHETPRTNLQHVMIGIGPFFVNTVIGGAIAFPSALSVIQFHSGSILDYILVWLGVSIAMHAFPSTGDAKSIWAGLTGRESRTWQRVVFAPIVGLIYAGAIGSFFWLDLAYGVAIATGPSLLIAKILA